MSLIRSDEPAPAVEVAIANGESLSAAVDLVAERLHRVAMPAAWTSAALTFQASDDGVTYRNVYNEFGEYQIASGVVGVDRTIVVDPTVFSGIRYLKVRSGTGASAVNQGAARTLRLVTMPRL